jgi:hypothetical protein
VPESKVRKEAAAKQKQAAKDARAQARADQNRHVASPGSRQWVVPAFVTVGLLGVLWLIVYYVTFATNITVPLLTDLGGWNVVIGMGGMAAAFGLATLWK